MLLIFNTKYGFVLGLIGAAGTIVIGYRGTFAFGKDGLSDVKFRKLTRILVHGKVSLILVADFKVFHLTSLLHAFFVNETYFQEFLCIWK